jgi:hypothetical protein
MALFSSWEKWYCFLGVSFDKLKKEAAFRLLHYIARLLSIAIWHVLFIFSCCLLMIWTLDGERKRLEIAKGL